MPNVMLPPMVNAVTAWTLDMVFLSFSVGPAINLAEGGRVGPRIRYFAGGGGLLGEDRAGVGRGSG
jgi:hypothetical protein